MQIRKSYPASCIDKKAPQKHPPQKTSNKKAHSPEANQEEALYRAYHEFGAQFAPFYSMPLALDNFMQSFFLYILRFFLYNPCCTKRQLRNLNKVYSSVNISVHAYILSRFSHVQHISVTEFELQSYGLQPARFHCPGDSPGKNTGVGCRVLLQGIFLT